MILNGIYAYGVDQAYDSLISYHDEHHATVDYYDLGGPDEIDVQDSVTPADLGRLILINARVSADDAAFLLERGSLGLDAAGLGIDLRFLDVEFEGTTSPIVEAMQDVWYGLKKQRGLKTAKVSKLLHLKRPNLFPIIDSRIVELYEPESAHVRGGHRWRAHEYWAAIASDLRSNAGEMVEIRTRLAARSDTAQRLVHVSDLRIHDILAWRAARTSKRP